MLYKLRASECLLPEGLILLLGKRRVLELMGSPWRGDWWWRDPPCRARRLGKKEKIGRFRARAHQLLGLSAEHQSAPLCLVWSSADHDCPFATCSWDPYLLKISTLSFSDPVFNCRRIILQTHKLKVLSVRLHLSNKFQVSEFPYRLALRNLRRGTVKKNSP